MGYFIKYPININIDLNKNIMKEVKLKKVEIDPVTLSIEPQTRLLLVKQGTNEVKLTRDAVIGLKKLKEGKIESGVFTTSLVPNNRLTVNNEGNITIICKDDWEDNAVILKKHHKVDDYDRLIQFVDSNRARIAWDRDLRGRY